MFSCITSSHTPKTPLFSPTEDHKSIKTKLKSQYLKDRRVTNLIHGTKLNQPLTYDSSRNIWKSGEKVIDLNKKSGLCLIGFKKIYHKTCLKVSKDYPTKQAQKRQKIAEAFVAAHKPAPKRDSISTLSEPDPSKTSPTATPIKKRRPRKKAEAPTLDKPKKEEAPPKASIEPEKPIAPPNKEASIDPEKSIDLIPPLPKKTKTSLRQPSFMDRIPQIYHQSHSRTPSAIEYQIPEPAAAVEMPKKVKKKRSSKKPAPAPYSIFDGFFSQVSASFKPETMSAFETAQSIKTNPLTNFKAAMQSILKQDAYFKNTLRPALKMIGMLSSPDLKVALSLAKKWEEKLISVATIWSKSNSCNQPNDDVLGKTPTQHFVALSFAHDLFSIMSQIPFSAGNLLPQIKGLKISKSLSIELDPKQDPLPLLTEHLKNRADLSPLFLKDSPLLTWPPELQFLIAFGLHNLKTDMQKAKQDETFKTHLLAGIAAVKKVEIPPFLVALISGASNWTPEWVFNKGFAALIPTLSEYHLVTEIEFIKTYESEYLESGLSKETLHQCKSFALDPDRVKFYQEYNEFIRSFREDVLTLVKERVDKKEFELKTLLVNGFELYSTTMELLTFIQDYLNTPTDQKLIAIENKQKEAFLKYFTFLQLIAPLLTKGANFVQLTKTLDEVILPNIQKNPPSDLTRESSFSEWIQQQILEPIQMIN